MNFIYQNLFKVVNYIQVEYYYRSYITKYLSKLKKGNENVNQLYKINKTNK